MTRTGRPPRPLAPKIDVAPEQLASVVLGSCKPDQKRPEGKTYRCASCRKEVMYPEILYDNGKYHQCH